MTYTISVTVTDEGFWMARIVRYDEKNYPYTIYGEVCDNPGEAVETLLKAAGVLTRTGARVLEAAE